jgi:death-on-curing protein
VTQEPIWVPLSAIIELHASQIAEHGGSPGLRDQSLLESALAHAQQRFNYSDEPASLADLAAAYAFGISQNHPFVDGNKRMALIAAAVFLDLNGLWLDARESETFDTFMALAANRLTEVELATWIAANIAVLEP